MHNVSHRDTLFDTVAQILHRDTICDTVTQCSTHGHNILHNGTMFYTGRSEEGEETDLIQGHNICHRDTIFDRVAQIFHTGTIFDTVAQCFTQGHNI